MTPSSDAPTPAIGILNRESQPPSSIDSLPDPQTRPYEWILHPVLDLLFCCGGAVWIFYAIHFLAFGPESTAKPVQIMLALSALGAIGLSETHVVATLQRIYCKRDQRRKFAPYTVWAAVGCALVGLAGCFFEQLVPVFLKVYLLFVAQHFTAQTYGLALLYCAKRAYVLKAWEKRILGALMQSTMLAAVLRQLTFRDWGDANLFGYQLPFWGPLPAWICQAADTCVGICALAMVMVVGRKWQACGRFMPLPAVLLTVTGVVIFIVGKHINSTLWIYVPAFFHGSQYIAVSLAFYLKEKGLPAGISAREIATQVTEPVAIRYLTLLFVCAVCFFHGLPFAAHLIGLKATTIAASTFAAIHFHHFLADRAIWKLRDSDVRKLLIA